MKGAIKVAELRLKIVWGYIMMRKIQLVVSAFFFFAGMVVMVIAGTALPIVLKWLGIGGENLAESLGGFLTFFLLGAVVSGLGGGGLRLVEGDEEVLFTAPLKPSEVFWGMRLAQFLMLCLFVCPFLVCALLGMSYAAHWLSLAILGAASLLFLELLSALAAMSTMLLSVISRKVAQRLLLVFSLAIVILGAVVLAQLLGKNVVSLLALLLSLGVIGKYSHVLPSGMVADVFALSVEGASPIYCIPPFLGEIAWYVLILLASVPLARTFRYEVVEKVPPSLSLLDIGKVKGSGFLLLLRKELILLVRGIMEFPLYLVFMLIGAVAEATVFLSGAGEYSSLTMLFLIVMNGLSALEIGGSWIAREEGLWMLKSSPLKPKHVVLSAYLTSLTWSLILAYAVDWPTILLLGAEQALPVFFACFTCSSFGIVHALYARYALHVKKLEPTLCFFINEFLSLVFVLVAGFPAIFTSLALYYGHWPLSLMALGFSVVMTSCALDMSRRKYRAMEVPT